MKIRVDYDRCAGLGVCESLAPEHFAVNDDGHLVVLEQVVSAEHLEAVQQACARCPTEALGLEP